MNEDIVFGLVSMLVGGVMLLGAYSKNPEPHEIVRGIKILFSPGKIIYVLFWVVFVAGVFQFFQGLNIV